MDNFLENNEWARHPGFDHFWRHYAVCERWQQQHQNVVRQMTVDDAIEEPEIIRRLSRCEIVENVEKIDERHEISQEMRDFFAKTQEHRKNLKQQREAEKRREESEKPWHRDTRDEYVDVQKISVRGRHVASAEHRDANAEFQAKRRRAERDYGPAAAARIMAMESVVEMRFEHEYATSPPMWPCIPFRF